MAHSAERIAYQIDGIEHGAEGTGVQRAEGSRQREKRD